MKKIYTKYKTHWFVYIIHMNCRKTKEHFFGKKEFYYTGITKNIGRRLKEYRSLKNYCNKGFLNKFKSSKRRLVYLEHAFDNEFDVSIREKKIKRMSPSEKLNLINSDNNHLIKVFLDKMALIYWEAGRKIKEVAYIK